MNEHETNPQRHETPATPEPSHRPADASPEDASVAGTPVPGASPQRGESEPTTAEQPVVESPTAAQPVVEGPAAQPPASGPPQPSASPWQSPQHHPYGQQFPGQPQPGPGYPGPSPWAGAGAPHPGQPHPGQPGQPLPGQPLSGQPLSGQPGQPLAGQPHPGLGGHGPQPPYPGGYQPTGGTQPTWVQPVATDTRPASSGRGRRIFVAGFAAILIALAGGGIGAATVLAMDDDGNSTVQTGNSSVTRVVDRSSLAQIASAVQDSVVSITTGTGEGSGVVLNSNGDIVTNNHVVSTARGKTVNVIFADGKKATATIVGTDPRTDLAVIRATGVSGLKPATLGDSAQMQVGDTVLALGSPLGLEGSVTAGIISAKDRTIRSESEQPSPQDPQQQDPQQPNPFGGQQQEQPPQQQQSGATSMSGLLQTDAPINPGNSGGALVNTNGQVIGINSAIYTSGGSQGNIGLGFAIPSNKVKQVVDALIAGKKVSHPALGVSVTEGENGGALVRAVTEGSAAAKAGIAQGDVITAVDGKAVNDSDDLVGVIQGAAVGDKVTIDFSRDGAKKTVTATLAEAG
ncbi:trypsin-like peptidase domain-containing protein [Actinoplanes sp. NBRC 103695]|uniref:S1C family serine protease n=1 Tax=Actinoplanes sp. NBRC 103695 TaxID=3032202 RepID=UPI002552D053|nr:trypsin-like peptidase domain-containing protein [Actinoplanes sp. NBRC 103695]